MAVDIKEGSMPHIFWIDKAGDGVYVECAVMKRDHLGNVYYFQLNALDDVDKRRLSKIINNRNSEHFELWDLMSNITLNNGVNALEYFHQLVTMLTPGGQTMKPQEGVVGVGVTGAIDTRGEDSRNEMEANVTMAAQAAATAAANAATQAIKDMTAAANAPAANAPAAQATKAPAKKPAAKK